MFGKILALIVAAFIAFPIPKAPDAPTKALKGVVKLYNPPGQCSAFQIGSITYLTAGHCVMDTGTVVLLVRGKPVFGRVGKTDQKADLALVESQFSTGTSLKMGPRPIEGDRLHMMGFGDDSPFAFWVNGDYLGNFMVTDRDAKRDGMRAIILGAPRGGMSGGPVLNDKGEYVGVTQMSTGFMGAAATYETLTEFLKR